MTVPIFRKILVLILIFLISACGKKDFLSVLDIEDNTESAELIIRNRINLRANAPFYVLKKNTFLYTSACRYLPEAEDVRIKITDIVFPVLPYKEINKRFYAKDINGQRGWVDLYSGISLDYGEDLNLYFFSDARSQYYLSHYKENKGKVSDSYKVILYKNIIPMLLGNFKTPGWFYPDDYETALELAEHAVSISEDVDTFFYASTMHGNWRINEFVISQNLLSDAYHKTGDLYKAADIHNMLIRRYFWKRADNTQIGGLNSSVKLVRIYIDLMNSQKKTSEEYFKYRELIIKIILTMDDSLNFFTVMDREWNQTASEWMIDLLSRYLSDEEFIEICNIIIRRTKSIGYSDLVNIHKAIKLYEMGNQEEAMKIFTSTRPRHGLQKYLNLNDWISEKQIIPDSIIYQYERF